MRVHVTRARRRVPRQRQPQRLVIDTGDLQVRQPIPGWPDGPQATTPQRHPGSPRPERPPTAGGSASPTRHQRTVCQFPPHAPEEGAWGLQTAPALRWPSEGLRRP